jgi:hypothetical protein
MIIRIGLIAFSSPMKRAVAGRHRDRTIPRL